MIRISLSSMRAMVVKYQPQVAIQGNHLELENSDIEGPPTGRNGSTVLKPPEYHVRNPYVGPLSNLSDKII